MLTTILYHENSAVTSCSGDLMFGKVADVIAPNNVSCDISSPVCGRGIHRWTARGRI